MGRRSTCARYDIRWYRLWRRYWYGSARFLNIEEVKNVDIFLSTLNPDYIQSRFNIEELGKNDIYPNNWNAEDCDYLAGYFDDLKAFYKNAVDENKMVIQYLN